MIYIFCNQKYGLQFILTAAAYAKTKNATLSLVISDKRPLPRTPIKRLATRAWRFLQRLVQEKRLELRYGVPVIVTENVNSACFRKKIAPMSHGIITGFNQIFDKDIIAKFETFVNFHPSILPLYRGPTPSYWCIRNGECTTGYTVHEVGEKVDEGKVLFQEEVEIKEEFDAFALDEKIASTACPTFKKYLEYIEEKTPWEQKLLNAYEVYSNHVSYISFPE